MMRIMKYIRKFLSLDFSTMKLFMEASCFLLWSKVLLLFPFSKVAPSLGIAANETAKQCSKSNKEVIHQVALAIHVMSRFTFWHNTCLVKAIAGMKMLERRKIESTLYLGTSKSDAGHLLAHAWLRSGSVIVTGASEMKNYTVVRTFVKECE